MGGGIFYSQGNKFTENQLGEIYALLILVNEQKCLTFKIKFNLNNQMCVCSFIDRQIEVEKRTNKTMSYCCRNTRAKKL